MTDIFVTIAGEVFGVRVDLAMQIYGGPFSIRLTASDGLSLNAVWNAISAKLYDLIGVSLPDLSDGPWKAILGIDSNTKVLPTLYIGPVATPGQAGSSKTQVYLGLELTPPIRIGGTGTYGPFTITLTPDVTIHALYLGYEDGLDFRAKISTPTTTGVARTGRAGALEPVPGPDKFQIVTYPFPVPAQSSSTAKAFQFKYLGLGQRVGPDPVTNVDDPLEAIFQQLETEFTATDPTTVLTRLATKFYHPDRDWFVAAHVIVVGWDIKVLFNDPAMYGLRIYVPMMPPSPFAGLLFEILYQKLGPNLGVYYGALTLPYLMRRIVLEGVILILPGFSIWVYTNGDFRVNIGWPLGEASFGIQVGVLNGIGGFYFGKLRSGDNPGAQPSVNYNPIVIFGIGLSIYVKQGFNASIFSATIDVSLTATLQGLLAWYADSGTTGPPDHYWFAGAASLSVLIEGSIDFAILKASVVISLQAQVSVAFETGYSTVIAVSAQVSVSIKVKIVFFTIHLSFKASISHQFVIGSGPNASPNGPLDKNLTGFVTPGQLTDREWRARSTAAALLDRFGAVGGSPRMRAARRTPVSAGSPTTIDLFFFLQPTVVYTDDASAIEVIATLFVETSSDSSPSGSPFEILVDTLVNWLVDNYSDAGLPWSQRIAQVASELGAGSEPPGSAFGGWTGFASAMQTFRETAVTFNIQGVDANASPPGSGSMAVLPMLDNLRLSYASAGSPPETEIDFASFNRTPVAYPDAVSLYFEGLPTGAPKSVADELRALGQPDGPSMASYLLTDYFLLLSRNVIDGLKAAAVEAEADAERAYFDRLELARHDDLGAVSIVADYCASITNDRALRSLLDGIDYASAAGIGSRYLLSGLQLPDPDRVPDHPTRENMRDVPTSGLYVLTGQQFPTIPGAAEGSATLSWDASSGPLPAWVRFDESGGSATARIDIPTAPPARPSPAWQIGVEPPKQLTQDVIAVSPLPPISPSALYYGMKNQTAWSAPDEGGARTVLPLPQQLMDRARQSDVAVAITSAEPSTHLDALAAHRRGLTTAATDEIDSVPGLLIRLTLSQVAAEAVGAVGASGSPSTSSPGNSGSSKYLPFVYQVAGTDEQTRDLIYAALAGDLTGASIQMLYPSTDGDSLQSEAFAPTTLIAKTNLTTLNQAAAVNANQFLRASALLASDPPDFAPATDVRNFLRLIWELSVVNAPGYYLFYESAHGDDLPSSLFSNAGVQGGDAQFQIMVTFGKPASRPTLTSAQNCVWIPMAAPRTTLYAGVLTPDGDPVRIYGPTYPAGTAAFALEWAHTPSSPSEMIPVGDLYQMIQTAILPEGGYVASNWSLPAGPAQNRPGTLSDVLRDDEDWKYTVTLPISEYFGAPSPPDRNRYCMIGSPVSVGFRLDDMYGNALPDVHQASVDPLYNDPLIGLGEWPGVQAHYAIVPASGGEQAAVLAISAVFDPSSLSPEITSPSGSPAASADSAKERWEAVLVRYQLVLDQLRDPNTSVRVKTTLSSQEALDSASFRRDLERFAEEIEEQVTVAIAGASYASDPFAGPTIVSRTLTALIPFAEVRALSRDIVLVGVSVETSRDPKFVDPDVQRRLPAVQSVAYVPGAEARGAIDSPASSPPDSGGIAQFARDFEAAFVGFDGGSGSLVLAQSSGDPTISSGAEASPLWAVRLSPTAGIAVRFDSDDPVYFGLKPLSTSLLSQPSPATGRMYLGVDLDQWASEFLQAFENFILPRNAVAVAILDLLDGTGYFDRLMQAKSSLATSIPNGLAAILERQEGEGDIDAASERLTQALLQSLGNAFSVSTIAQAKATVFAAAPESVGSPGTRPAQLYGPVAPPDRGSSPSGPRQYSLSNGSLDLQTGERLMTLLVSVTQPQEQSELVMPLEFLAAYLQHDFHAEDSGYVASSWLKFVLPDAAALRMSVTGRGEAHIPIPLPFYPGLPALGSQSASAVEGGSPDPAATLTDVENEIARALRWKYSAQISHDWAAQDELYFTATFNLPASELSMRAMAAGEETLFDALANFRDVYALVSPQLGLIAAEAYPGPGTGSPSRATEVIDQFTTATERVAAAWTRYWPDAPFRQVAAFDSQVIRDEFYARQGVASKSTLHLFGRTGDGANPEFWPRVTPAGSAGWTPDRSAARQTGSPGEWWTLSHDFEAGVDFDVLTLEWEPLDVLERQTATLSAQVVRNANLLGDDSEPTNPAFVYRSPVVAFSGPIVPLIQRASIPPLTPDASLALTIEAILAPMVSLAHGTEPYLRIGATYSFQLVPPAAKSTGGGLRSSIAIMLADGVRLGESGSPVPSVAAEMAREIADWYVRVGPLTTEAELVLSLAVFGTIHDEQLPLVQIGEIPIVVSQVPLSWWTGNGKRAPR